MKNNLFSNNLPEEAVNTPTPNRQKLSGDFWLWGCSAVLCLVFIIIIARLAVVWNRQSKNNQKLANQADNQASQLSEQALLPVGPDVALGTVARDDSNFQADQLIFGQIYQAPTTSWSVDVLADQAQAPKLPMNIKGEAVNYYEIRRHYDLEPLVDQLNKQGTALADNPFGKPEQDFFSFYRAAQTNKWPLLLTNDVIFYYYQNNLKDVYKALEAGFYDGLWQISSDLFEVANRRYQALASQAVGTNDPMLEAYRLNAQYWAVTLKLLAPKSNQINNDGLAASTIVFQSGDDQIYRMPALDSDLGREVDQEVALVQGAKEKKISPLFGQTFDYSFFKPDASYQAGGRLANFALASQWLGRPWPAYYRSPTCPECQLDIDDWRASFLAANILARDLASNQKFKNYWAKIYKTISYFAGLRDDLTYVHYAKAQKKVLGDKSLEQVVRLDDKSRNQLLDKLQADILKNNFSSADGGWDRSQPKVRPNIGLRVLQDHYWPGQTVDWTKVSSTLDSYIKKQQTQDWQANQFWSSLSLLKNWLAKTLVADKSWLRPAWWRSQHLALAKFYLVNWQLPADQWSAVLPDSGLAKESSLPESLVVIDSDSLPAIDQQLATIKMLRLALAKLQVSNLLSEEKLNETSITLRTIRDLAAKQAAGQAWTKDEAAAINIFFQRQLASAGRKTLAIKPVKGELSLQRLRAKLEVKLVSGQPQIFIGPVLMP